MLFGGLGKHSTHKQLLIDLDMKYHYTVGEVKHNGDQSFGCKEVILVSLSDKADPDNLQAIIDTEAMRKTVGENLHI